MNWKEAWKLLLEGKKMKLPSWKGYWYWDEETNTVKMHLENGAELDLRSTDRVQYTMSNIASDEWVVADENNTPALGGTIAFNFETALKYIKRGFKVARSGWNGKGMFVKVEIYGQIDNPLLLLRNVAGKYNTWIPSITDLFAEDWCIVEDKI